MSPGAGPGASGADSGQRLAPDEIALWVLDRRQTDAGALRAFESHASEDERQYADKFSNVRLRDRYLSDHGFLRVVLARYLGRLPAEIPIARTPFGKPYAADASVRFNLSHSGEVTLVAVALGCELGVDVECVRDDLWLDEVARTYFSPSELAALGGLPGGQRSLAFLTIWVRKEALIKAWGRAISAELLRELHVGAGPVTEIAREGRSWCVQQLDMGSGYVAALAAGGDARRVVRRALG